MCLCASVLPRPFASGGIKWDLGPRLSGQIIVIVYIDLIESSSTAMMAWKMASQGPAALAVGSVFGHGHRMHLSERVGCFALLPPSSLVAATTKATTGGTALKARRTLTTEHCTREHR